MKLYTHKDWKGKYLYLNENFEQDYRQGKYLNIDKEEVVLCWNNLMDEITFQEAFADEIESIVKQYKDAHDATLAVNAKAMKYMDEAHEANSKLKAELEEKTKCLNQSRHKNIELNLSIKELQSKIDDLKLERDQLVIDYDELENKKFDSDLIKVDVRIDASQNGNDWYYLAEKTGIVIESLGDIEIYKTQMITDKFIRVKLVSKSTDYGAMYNNLLTNDEYAMRTQIESLKKENKVLQTNLNHEINNYKIYLDKF